MSITTRRIATVAVAALVLCGMAAEAAAEKRNSLDEGPSVRRKQLYRSDRFELMPSVGFTINDAYKRNILVGAEANFHLTNEFGIGVTGQYGAVALNSDLLDQIESTIDPDVTKELAYGTTMLLVDAHLSYVPLFGKFSVFRTTIDYDLHLLAGFGGALIASAGDGEGGDLEGFNPGPMFGGGARFFFADSIAFTLDVKDYIYTTADVQERGNEPTSELRDNWMMSIGISIFFPGKVAISR